LVTVAIWSGSKENQEEIFSKTAFMTPKLQL